MKEVTRVRVVLEELWECDVQPGKVYVLIGIVLVELP